MADIDTSYLDADTDKVKPARGALLQAAQRLNDLASAASSSKGAGLAGYNSANAYAGGTVGGRLNQTISVVDLRFMTLAQIADVTSYAGTLDVTACIQAALDCVANTTWSGTAADAYAKGGGAVFLPPGRYKITDTLKVGANTELYGVAPTGRTAISITDPTGSIIECAFSGEKKKWAISSATYETASGTFAAFDSTYSGSQYDSGAITLTHGIRVHSLCISGNGVYGGVRLLASSGFEVRDVIVDDVGVGFLFNTSYGGRYSGLYSLFSLYGLFMRQCNAIEGGHVYLEGIYSTWTPGAATRLVSTFDMSSSAFMPNWIDKTFAIYADGCIGLDMRAHTGEHADVGLAFSNVSNFKLHGYFEGNAESNLGFVTSSGTVTAFGNATTEGTKFHFGVNNDITLADCTRGAIYVGHAQNTIRVHGGNGIGSGSTDWTWSDAIEFLDLDALLVSATGSSGAVLGYTTLDEAMRRIAASSRRDWKIRIKDGDTVTTGAHATLKDKRVVIESEGGGTRPTLSVGAAGGGFVYRYVPTGSCEFVFRRVNVSFPTGTAAAAGDSALFLIAADIPSNVELNVEASIVHLGNAYSLFQVAAGGALRLDAAWADAAVTSTNPARIATVDGAALIASIASSSVAVDSGIKALGTNGWGGTVLNSNF